MQYKTGMLVVLALIFLTTGCAQKKLPSQEPQPDPALSLLNDAAKDIQGDLDKLTRIREAKAKKVEPKVHDDPHDTRLLRKISFFWTGPLSPATEVLAQKAGYDYREVGKKPVQTIFINLDVKDVSLFRVLEKVGYQAGEKASLVVDESKQIIMLKYN